MHQTSMKDSAGKTKLKVTYPKFKKGEATVREVKEKQDLGLLLLLCVNVTSRKSSVLD